MLIQFADGTQIEVAESALKDFVRHDLKWVEFVHGRASEKKLLTRAISPAPASAISRSSRCCASRQAC